MRTLRLFLLLTVALTALTAGPALAAPKVDGVFDLPGVQTNGQLTVGPEGNVWVSLEQAVGKVKPDGASTAITTGGLADTLGFPTGHLRRRVHLGQPAARRGPGDDREDPAGEPAGAQGVAVPGVTAGTTAMTTGPDGNIWVGLPDKLVKFSPGDPAAATPYPTPGVTARAIAPAPDGTLYLTDPGSGHLWNVPTTGQFALTGLSFGGQPQFLGVSPDGQVAFGNPNSDPQQIGLVRLHDPFQQYQQIDRPNGSDPFGVAFGADGAFWVAEFAGNRLARVTPSGQLTTLGGLPVVGGQGPRQITAGPGNTLWVTLDKPGSPADTKIARITGLEPPAPPPVPGGGTPGGGAPGAGGGAPADTTPPAITAAKLSRARFASGTRGVSFTFTLSEPGKVKLVLSRRLAGRRRGASCVKPTRALRRAKACTRLAAVRTITLTGKAGANAIALGTKGIAAAGGYSAALTVSDAAGNRARPLTRTFTVGRRATRR